LLHSTAIQLDAHPLAVFTIHWTETPYWSY